MGSIGANSGGWGMFGSGEFRLTGLSGWTGKEWGERGRGGAGPGVALW